MLVHVPSGHESIDLGDIVILGTFEIRVVVETSSGEPLIGAEVELIATPPYGRNELSATVIFLEETDERGRARFPPIPRRDDWSLCYTARHPDVLPGSGDLALLPLLSNDSVRIVLYRGLTVVGRILGPDGRPSIAWIRVLGVDIDGRLCYGGSFGTCFRFRHEPGTYRMSFWAIGYRTQELGSVTISPECETVVDVSLSKE